MANKIEKAMKIVERFRGRLESRQIKDKIMSQCDMSENSASTYYYLCLDRLPKKKR